MSHSLLTHESSSPPKRAAYDIVVEKIARRNGVDIDKVKKWGIEVNVRGGNDHAWLHSDEIFEYKHEKMFTPNQDELVNLMKSLIELLFINITINVCSLINT